MKRSMKKYIIIAAVLIVAVICSPMISQTYAKYVSQESSTASATFASFVVGISSNIQEDGTEEFSSQISGVNSAIELEGVAQETVYKYKFDVANYDNEIVSQTDVEYTVEISTTGNIPFEFKLTQTGAKNSSGADVSDYNGVVRKESYYGGVIEDTGMFTAGSGEVHSYTVEFYLEDLDASYAGAVDFIEVVIVATQAINN